MTGILSINAIHDCMRFLSLNTSLQTHAPVRSYFENNNKRSKSGTLHITFMTGGNGSPEIDCPQHIIQGYGINHSHFTATYQTFTFNRLPDGRGTLTCDGQGYSFDMTFEL